MAKNIIESNDLFSIDSTFIAAGCACRSNIVDVCQNTNTLIFASNNDFCIAELDESTVWI